MARLYDQVQVVAKYDAVQVQGQILEDGVT